MSKFILGSKLNMSQVFDQEGRVVPVTVISAGPVKIVQVKKSDGKDKYDAVQVGFGKKAKTSKALAGHTKTNGNFKFLREFIVKGEENFEVGQELNTSQFEVGDFVDVQGVMKGRGFTGPVKRYDFKGAPKTHGHDHPRAVGSIGQRFPQHTMKGKRMAGRMGGHYVTVKNLLVVEIDAAKNLMAVRGAIPGANGSLVTITQSLKASKK
ncbi:MAG: 50S ribosomal protein L3 [Candidatus Doudnabacteria bacterium RIFCSPHIGHO2_02_FULL_46_11]|uniref:Large ribosomal subunit protein uL3 n=1 Tax=Candidatus Doudnabacteria bacterium RIFCSPHIGHO2_02_FULL_46_11 TaxID=1817832 RepID=A0A1F5P5M5_9BACT|nr:ribosomal protein L3 [uncultured bacterium]OGE85114.1 MAG: 50S ribosomal protein L3 [Candidatus Doudnabacteria bacterium RIFCSPHIGHO2_02_FULL_46_11]